LSDCDPFTEDDQGRNALYYALRKGSSAAQMATDILEFAWSQPQPLVKLCRTAIRRVVRARRGAYGKRLYPIVMEGLGPDEIPRTLKHFLAYKP